jgi:hypothetical protein
VVHPDEERAEAADGRKVYARRGADGDAARSHAHVDAPSMR